MLTNKIEENPSGIIDPIAVEPLESTEIANTNTTTVKSTEELLRESN